MANVEAYLRSHQIEFVVYEHPPVMTCDELASHQIPGLACKNLFLRDQKLRRFFLLVMPAIKKADLKQLGKSVLGTKVSFANAELLQEKLGVEPGAVSPFGLLNDHNLTVEVFIDKEVVEAELTHFHPNRNTVSIVLTREMFSMYLSGIRHTINVFN